SRMVMQILTPRKYERKLMDTIKNLDPKAFIIAYEPRNIHGGFQFTGLTPREMIYFGQTQGRSPQLLNRMTTYNEVDNLTKNN
ncbi:C47 family peptidase, partial [Staphylococcus sp. EG-SA-23]|uniref:C47 family peptidase n=1 Tax=Staphylococcus sp. EG-SA-23 TaxID=2767497 RepID=UPI001F11C2BA